MDGKFFVLGIILISTLGWVITSWIRARHGYPLENEWGGKAERHDPQAERKIELLGADNEKLQGRITRLEERIAVLERIATDQPSRLAAEIDKLR